MNDNSVSDWWCSVFSSGWVEGVHLNTTYTGSLLNCESHVAALTPAGAPRVLHDPELFSVLFSVTNDECGVIESLIGKATWRVEDSAFVNLENRWVSFNKDRDWLKRNCCLHLVDVRGFNGRVAGNFCGGSLCCFVLACTIFAGIWVRIFGLSHVV